MKGLVLAGGAGKRLRPFTHSGPKQLVPIANRPVLFYALDQLANAGIRDVGVVVSPESLGDVRAAAGGGERFGLALTYVVQDRPGGLAHAVAAARGFLGGAPFCMLLGDNVIGAPLRLFAEAFAADERASALVLLKEVDDPRPFGVAELAADGRLVRLVEKPAVPPSRLALVGAYFFREAIHGAIEALRPSARGELEITDAIGALLASGQTVRHERLDSFWLDTGKKDDLLLANEAVLDAWAVRDIGGAVDGASLVSGRVSIAEGATVVRSTVRGPAVVGAGARLEDAHVGPFSSVGPRVAVLRSSVERCVILEDARVEDVPRLRDSVVGRRVVVQALPGPRGGVSLWVGDDCRVELPERGA